nr:uncharacterized protein LOC129381498 isoform X1 [Dermacentor andersoni]
MHTNAHRRLGLRIDSDSAPTTSRARTDYTSSTVGDNTREPDGASMAEVQSNAVYNSTLNGPHVCGQCGTTFSRLHHFRRHLAMHLYWEAIDEERGAKVEEKAEPLDHQQLLDKADLDAGRRPLDEAEERRETCGQLPGKRRKADGVRGTSRPLTRSYRNMILRKRIKREH